MDVKPQIRKLCFGREIGDAFLRTKRQLLDYRVSTLRRTVYNHFFKFMPGSPTVTCMDFDNTYEDYMLTGHSNGQVSVTDLTSSIQMNRNNTTTLRRSQGYHEACVSCCKWYPTDEKLFATAGHDQVVRLWDAPTREMMDGFIEDCPVTDIEWLVIGNQAFVLVAQGIPQVYVRPVREQDHYPTLECRDQSVVSVRYHNGYIFTGSSEGILMCWDTRVGERDQSLNLTSIDFGYGHSEPSEIIDMKLARNHGCLVVYTRDRCLHFWNLQTFQYEGYVLMSNVSNVSNEEDNPMRFDVYDNGSKLWAAVPEEDGFAIRGMTNPLMKNYNATHVETVAIKPVIMCKFRPKYQQLFVSSKDKQLTFCLPDGDERYPPSNNNYPQHVQLHDDFSSDEDI